MGSNQRLEVNPSRFMGGSDSADNALGEPERFFNWTLH
jgi:hypothetical protein